MNKLIAGFKKANPFAFVPPAIGALVAALAERLSFWVLIGILFLLICIGSASPNRRKDQ